LNAYPGGFIIVCHDEGFLEKLSLDTSYIIENKTLKLL
jgi:ATPase subunit of ABC transporter with duplicated ATPase domains